MQYGKIGKPFWDDKPVAVVAGGPSLVDFDYERLRGAHVLAVKGAIFGIPWADAGFGIDTSRYIEWHDRLASMPSRVYWAVPEGQLEQAAPSKNVTFLKRLDGPLITDDPGVIYDGGTSGFGAMQVCLHKRAKQIVLFGFDYDAGHNIETGFAQSRRRSYDRRYEHWTGWANHFAVYKPHLDAHGVSVVNACPQSNISCFRKVSLGDGVNMLRGLSV